MSIPKNVVEYLKKKGVKFEIVPHKTVFTAFDLSQTLKKKLNEIAKTLLVKADKQYVLVTIPAHYRLDLDKVKKYLKAKKVSLAPEKLILDVLKVKAGALTPFGGLHRVALLVDKALLKVRDAIIGAGSFTESLRMKAQDLHKMENATLGNFGKAAEKAAKKAVKKVKKEVKKALKPSAVKKVKKAVLKK